jgi:catechol 2,3-dioxygenase-like lactoylglutathione lyase family enzyme
MDAANDFSVAGIELLGLGGVVLGVDDPDAASDFYCRVLGCRAIGADLLPNSGAHRLVATGSGALIAFAAIAAREDVRDSGVHVGLRTTAAGRDALVRRLAAEGVAIHGYREDRAAEQDDRFYFTDPAGNRLQFVARAAAKGGGVDGIDGIDHVCIQVSDMMWGEEFYGRILGLAVESRFGLRTADHAQARIWARGEDDMAPGTRRNDKLYMMMGGQKEVPRTNMQVYFEAGDGIIGVYLATRHVQEPREEDLFGTPRMMIAAPRAALDAAAGRLGAAGRPFIGPIEHGAAALVSASFYFRDTGGNFIELFTPRGA